MSFEIVPLEHKHLADAASLVCARYRALREGVPLMPARYEDPGVILPLLEELSARAPGVAALRGARLIGFLVGFAIPSFRGRRSVFSPEWANAAALEESRRIYEEMYARLCVRWLANGCYTHLVSILANDRDAIEGWQWLGFGLAAVDAVRGLEPVQAADAGVEIRRGRVQDVEDALALGEALQRYMAAAPTFLAYTQPDGRDHHERRLANPAHALWLAYHGAEALACIGGGPANPDACDIVRDEKTTSITAAYTRESARGRGIATALLNRHLEWARAGGYDRCAVDFEPMNLLAARFWTQHFQPVCYSLARDVDERLAWAHAHREHSNIW